MEVSRDEILHIANLASLNLKEEEIDKYIVNLQDILNFANIVNNAPVEGLKESASVNEIAMFLEKMKWLLLKIMRHCLQMHLKKRGICLRSLRLFSRGTPFYKRQ